MYTYAQVVHGHNEPTSFGDNLDIQRDQGTDTRADYSQGDYDYTDQPAATERTNAQHVTIKGYTVVGNPGGTGFQDWIESELASGNPIAISIPDYPEFDNVSSATNWVVGLPKPSESSAGGHAVFAPKYDAQGLWIENSWGTGWGKHGYGELSWAFVNAYAKRAVFIEPAAVHKEWISWFPIHPNFTSAPGAPVTAVWAPYSNQTHLDLFVAGADKQVHSTYWEQASGWQPWFPVGSGVSVNPNQLVTAVWRGTNHLDLFVTGTDKQVYRIYWEPGHTWQTWFVIQPTIIAGQGLAEPGAPVTAVWSPYAPQPHLDLFVTGLDGAVHSTYLEQASRWLPVPWFTIHPELRVAAGSPVAAVWAGYAPQTHLDLFVAGTDGAVHSTFWEQAPSWQPWFTVGSGVPVASGQPVTAVWQNTVHLDLFVVGSDGVVYSNYWNM